MSRDQEAPVNRPLDEELLERAVAIIDEWACAEPDHEDYARLERAIARFAQDYAEEKSRKDVQEALERAEKAIPSTWLDPLLTDDAKRVVGREPPYGCRDVERLLDAVRKRIRALKPAEREKEEWFSDSAINYPHGGTDADSD